MTSDLDQERREHIIRTRLPSIEEAKIRRWGIIQHPTHEVTTVVECEWAFLEWYYFTTRTHTHTDLSAGIRISCEPLELRISQTWLVWEHSTRLGWTTWVDRSLCSLGDSFQLLRLTSPRYVVWVGVVCGGWEGVYVYMEGECMYWLQYW